MSWKHHTELTIDECFAELEWLEHYFEECRQHGHGISTKDTVRYNACKARIDDYVNYKRHTNG